MCCTFGPQIFSSCFDRWRITTNDDESPSLLGLWFGEQADEGPHNELVEGEVVVVVQVNGLEVGLNLLVGDLQEEKKEKKNKE